MEALIERAKKISTVEEAQAFLFENIDSSSNIQRALSFAKEAHRGQYRKSGEPYIIHPIIVASFIASISNDETMVISALLHDVIEDTQYSRDDIERLFGESVALLVEGMTKIDIIRDEKLISSSSDKRLITSALNFRKMLIASIEDVRVLVIKLCDRLHNMLTLDALPRRKQLRISEETMVVYVPIAHRLGIGQLKNYLEDLSFYYIYPEAYRQIDEYIRGHSQSLKIKLNSFIQNIRELMVLNGFKEDEFEIFGRVKHYYSMYQKMQRKGITIDEILDMIAVRILVKEDIECYRVLGVLHINYKPIISRFKDYITLPKDNGYSTIHTTVFDNDGIVEAQIRTFQMHKMAEYGIAAHWKYKDGGTLKNSVNLDWLEALEYQSGSLEEFFSLAKGDLFSDDILLFSPDGDHYTLPRDALALDFAYAVHTDIGDRAKYALVNKIQKSLLTPLKNGDIVKIVTDDEVNIRCSWLNSVKTSRAKSGIKNVCNARIKESNRLSGLNIFSLLFNRDIEDILYMFDNSCRVRDNIYKISSNRSLYFDILNRFLKVDVLNIDREAFIYPKEYEREHFRIISNRDIKNIEFDYCCHPKVGDAIVAFYSGDSGELTVHHKLCKEAFKLMKSGKPMVYIEWATQRVFRYQLIVSLQNKKGILAELLQKLAVMDLNVLSIELGIKNSESAEFCKIDVETKEHNSKKLKDKLTQRFKLIDLINLNDAYN